MARKSSARAAKSSPLAAKRKEPLKAETGAQNIRNKRKQGKKTTKKGSAVLGVSNRLSDGKAKPIPDTQIKTAEEHPQLPQCPGPKLEIFKHHKAKIEWLERLDKDRDGDSGLQGYVFRVIIESTEYAIKIFKKYDIESKRYYWKQYLRLNHDPDFVANYMDPFFCECRAYGRIQEALRDKTLKASPAVKCYGYLFLSAADEQILENRGIDLGSNSSDDDEELTSQNEPIRAIVKQLAPPHSGVTVRQQGKIFTGIMDLNELKIYNRDIRADNYRGGLLVDFGSSMTEPDIILDAFRKDKKEDVYVQDTRMFKNMLEEENIKLKIEPSAIRHARTVMRPSRKRDNTKVKSHNI